MLLNGFLALIGISVFISFQNWRKGFYFLVLVGVLKDPVRKLVPGYPAYLTLSAVPIWGAMLLSAYRENPDVWRRFQEKYPMLSKAIFWFILSMIPPAFISATYGPGSWQLTLIGAFSYLTFIFGILTGFLFMDETERIWNVMRFFCVLTALMLAGTVFEYMGWRTDWKAIGNQTMGFAWIRYSGEGILFLISGFYKSPDVMGWHAAAMVMFATLLAIREKGLWRYLWAALIGWGIVCAYLSGRRKVVYLIPAFMFVFLWLNVYYRRLLRLDVLILIIISSLSIGFYIYEKIGIQEDFQEYYVNEADQVLERLEKHGIRTIIGTYRQSGFFGEGLGTATQGAHLLQVDRPRTWQEGGLSRVMVELGVIGLICFFILGVTFLRTIWNLLFFQYDVRSDFSLFRIGLISFILANFGQFIVAHMILSEPFVNMFFSFLIGCMLMPIETTQTDERKTPARAVSHSGGLIRHYQPR